MDFSSEESDIEEPNIPRHSILPPSETAKTIVSFVANADPSEDKRLEITPISDSEEEGLYVVSANQYQYLGQQVSSHFSKPKEESEN